MPGQGGRSQTAIYIRSVTVEKLCAFKALGCEPPHRQRACFSVGFEDGGPVGTTTSGERYTWTYFPERQALAFFARMLLPLRDGQRVELSQDRLCSLGLVPFEHCSKSAPLASSDMD